MRGVPSTWRKSREAVAVGWGGSLHPTGVCGLHLPASRLPTRVAVIRKGHVGADPHLQNGRRALLVSLPWTQSLARVVYFLPTACGLPGGLCYVW